MGCFSFLCKECDKGIESNSFSGQECFLFLLREGKVIQKMEGQYDSYGQCLVPDTSIGGLHDDDFPLSPSYHWDNPFPEIPIVGEPDPYKKSFDLTDNWSRVCDLMFSQDNHNGIAAFHQKCYLGIPPITRSDPDPNQGWGEDGELMGNSDPDHEYT